MISKILSPQSPAQLIELSQHPATERTWDKPTEGTPVTPLALCTPLPHFRINPIILQTQRTQLFSQTLLHLRWINTSGFYVKKNNYCLSHCLGGLLIPDSNTHTKWRDLATGLQTLPALYCRWTYVQGCVWIPMQSQVSQNSVSPGVRPSVPCSGSHIQTSWNQGDALEVTLSSLPKPWLSNALGVRSRETHLPELVNHSDCWLLSRWTDLFYCPPEN